MARRKDASRRRKSKQQHAQASVAVAARKSGSLGGAGEQLLSSHDAETVSLCEEALEAQDLPRLRQLACSRGLVSRQLRMRCWPLLLGLDPDGQDLPRPPSLGHSSCPPLSRQSSRQPSDASTIPRAESARSDSRLNSPQKTSGSRQQHPSVSRPSDEPQTSPSRHPAPGSKQGSAASDGTALLGPSGRVQGEDLEESSEGSAGADGPRPCEMPVDDCVPSTSKGGAGGGGAVGIRQRYEWWHSVGHRDSHVVKVDVDRSLWAFTPGMSDERRQVLRDQLRRLLDATVGRFADSDPSLHVYYYQGLHDVASVLLLEMGSELKAFPLLSRLVVGHLRDCTRQSLEPVLELLQLLWPLLQYHDRDVAQSLLSMGMPPFFALSWFITWFSHDVPDLQTAARLFDMFLCSHPLTPLYLGAVAMRHIRASLLACNEMHEAHSLLTRLDLRGEGMPPLDQLLAQALRLLERVPPKALLAGLGRDAPPLRLAVSPWSVLERGVWTAPDAPGPMPTYPPHMRGLQIFLSGLPLPLPQWLRRTASGSDLGDSPRKRARPLITALSLGGVLSVCVVAVVLEYTMLRAHSGGQTFL